MSLFEDAINSIPGTRNQMCQGLQALKKDSQRIKCKNTKNITGSLNLDKALEEKKPNDPRWDYGIGVKTENGEKVHWIEVHPGNDVNAVKRKFDWLEQWLSREANSLKKIPGLFVWIGTGHVHPCDRRRRIALSSVKFINNSYRLD